MSDKRTLNWPMVIAGLLTAHVAASLFFVYLATSNQSFAIEEDYYQKALHWDEKRAQDSTNRVLGWRLDAEVAAAATAGADATLRVRLSDRTGGPVDGATLTAEVFPIARAEEILRITLQPSGNGLYETTMTIHRPGRWELRFAATSGDDRFTHVTTKYLATRETR